MGMRCAVRGEVGDKNGGTALDGVGISMGIDELR